jgi:hypothetical protein
VARRHRQAQERGEAVSGPYDAALAAAGYLFVVALYVGLVVSVPPDQQAAPTGALAPLVAALYGLPQLAGLVPPLVAAVIILLCHRRLR